MILRAANSTPGLKPVLCPSILSGSQSIDLLRPGAQHGRANL